MSPIEPSPDEEFWAMARRVRQAAEEELAEIEYETERAELKRQDLTARTLQAMMEGERWLVSFGGRAVDGTVVHAGQNYVGLQDRAGNLHDVVHRAIMVITVVSIDPLSGRAPLTFRPATFRARLLSFEEVRDVEVGGRWGEWSLRGRIDSINADHLVFHERSGQVSLVPTDALGYVSRPVAEDRRGARSGSGRPWPR